jgi:hypothetical protein
MLLKTITIGLLIVVLCQEPDNGSMPLKTEKPEGAKFVVKQRAHKPAIAILDGIQARFEKLKPEMRDDEIFKTLGLIEYRKYLRENRRIQLDGAGGNWQIFLDNHGGYSLAFRDFLGGKGACYIKFPGDTRWRSKRTNAKPIDFTKVDLNKRN